jgi:preprotein translocase subunit SecY
MFKSLLNMFKIPELRNKVLFTLFMLMIYRVGYHVPLPGVDQSKIAAQRSRTHGDTPAERLADYVAIFSGGDLTQSTIFGLGIMPYISASIIFQLLATVVPSLEKLQKEGETGRRKIQEWTRYATVPLCIIQAMFWLNHMHSDTNPLVMRAFTQGGNGLAFWVMSLCALTAGCVFLMWLGEQIDEYGLGNGVSLIIMAGIVGRMPIAIVQTVQLSRDQNQMNAGKLLFLVASFVFIVTGAILITQAVSSSSCQSRRRHADHLRTVPDPVPRLRPGLHADAPDRPKGAWRRRPFH